MCFIPVNFGPADISGLKTNDKHTFHFMPATISIGFLKSLQFPDRFINGDGFRFRNLLKNFKYQRTHSPGTLIIIDLFPRPGTTCIRFGLKHQDFQQPHAAAGRFLIVYLQI